MTDTSSGQPYWFKEALEQLGLLTGGFKGKRVAVPNMTHYTSLIYKVCHIRALKGLKGIFLLSTAFCGKIRVTSI